MEYKMEYRLTDLCELIMGQSPDSSSCNKDGKGIPFYQGNADFGEKNPTPRNWCLQPKKIAQKDDILISVRAPIGDLNIANEDCCIGRGVAAIRMKSKECDRDYLYLFLESKSKYLQDCGTGSTFTAINKGVLESLKVECPELKNQTSIANEIENIKAAIKYKNSELICLNEAVQSEFVEMFGENPVESGKWKITTLGKIAEIGSSKRIFASEYVASGIPFYRSKEIIELSKNLKPSVELFISKERYEEIKNKNGVPEIGDILMTAVGTIGKFWEVNTDKPFYYKDGNLVYIRCKIFNSTFFRYILESLIEAFKQQNLVGSAYSALTIDRLKQMTVPMIELDLQNKFAAFVQQIDKSKFVVKQQIADLQELLDSKMQEYFS